MKNSRNECRACRTVRWAAAVALGAVVILTPSPAWSADRGQCALIEAPFPMILPDGSTHEAGSLKLCLQQMWTPASGMHEIVVNGKSIGVFMSRVGTSEEPAEGMPVVVFQRNGTEEYTLVGYAWPDGDFMRTYVLRKFEAAQRSITQKSRVPLFDWQNTEVLTAAPSL